MANAAHKKDDDCQQGRSTLAAKFPGWPVEPRPLHVFDTSSFCSIMVDVALLFLSITFIGVYLLQLCLCHHKPHFVHDLADQCASMPPVTTNLVIGATAWWLDGKAIEHHSWGYKVETLSRLVRGYNTWCLSPFMIFA